MKKQILLIGLVILGACGDLVPSTLWAVNRLDPLTTDPADIAVQLVLPDSVAVARDSGKLTFSARKVDGETLVSNFALTQVGDVFFVSPDQHADLRALQAKIREWKDVDPNGTRGSLSVTYIPCKTGPTVPAGLRATVRIRLELDGPFLTLIDDGPIDAVLEKASLKDIVSCA